MTPEEKIEALREWANQPVTDGAQLASLNWYREAQREVRDIIDPPKPRWRELVGQAAKVVTDNPLEGVLKNLSVIAYNPSPEGLEWNLARIVAVAEAQVGDGWEADPDSTAYGCAEQDVYDVFILLDPLANLTGSLCWKHVGDRAAAWLRSLTDEKPGTRTDAKYEHTLGPHCPVCFGVCAGSNRDGAA